MRSRNIKMLIVLSAAVAVGPSSVLGEAHEEFPGRGVVLAVQPGQEFSEGVRH